ncbi:MAG TPA: septum site-determining protein MinD [Bacillota bacterium]|jgi:septum site-determining protein MinD|nr:septum site-determining protein MinD [Bacillota bacterium]
MDGMVLVITSGKGGVGKTTTVANIGAALAALGRRVVLVDADIGLRNLDVVMGLENRIVYDIVNVMENKDLPVRKALIKDKRVESLFLLPAAQTRDKDAIKPEQMKELCEELRQEFDYVLIDCPAGIEQGFRNAVAGADLALIVTTPEVSAVRDADRIIGLVEAEGLRGPRLILNRLRPDMVKRREMMDIEDVLDILHIDLLGVVPDDEAIIISTNKGEPIAFDNNSKAGQAYRNIARRLEGEEVPFQSFDNPSFFQRLRQLVGMDK